MRVLEQHTGMTAHQTLLLEMLKDIDIVCKRHRISYQLFAGTALGAVRHHGFIPWDDDVDIIMSRSEYERFFKEAAKDFDETLYFAQQEHSAHWPMPYSKLRRNNTTCMPCVGETGIYICDCAPKLRRSYPILFDGPMRRTVRSSERLCCAYFRLTANAQKSSMPVCMTLSSKLKCALCSSAVQPFCSLRVPSQ